MVFTRNTAYLNPISLHYFFYTLLPTVNKFRMYRIFVLLVGIKATSFFPGQFLGTAPNVCRQKDAVEELGGTDYFPDLHPDDVKCGGNYEASEDMITSPYIPNVRPLKQ